MVNKKLFLLLLLFILLLSACFSVESQRTVELDTQGELSVHFLDVGQGDSIFVRLPNNESMLIDAGNNKDGDFITNYLKSAGVDKIDYLIATHPHADHIGAMDTVINAFDIGKIYMPRATNNTKTFEDVLTAIDDKGLSINTAKSGVSVVASSGLRADFVAPDTDNSTYSGLNDYSAVLKLTYGGVSFLFTGDAERLSETEMLSGDYDLKSDVLKIGHHGSDTSTSDEFLAAVNPVYAVISCGIDNSYGHPSESVLDRLSKNDTKVFRTDILGTVIIASDGEKIYGLE